MSTEDTLALRIVNLVRVFICSLVMLKDGKKHWSLEQPHLKIFGVEPAPPKIILSFFTEDGMENSTIVIFIGLTAEALS